jgi:hypothetical protein
MADDLTKRLRAAGRASDRATEAREKAATELREAVLEAVKEGMSKVDISKAAGINRGTVYEIIRNS